MSSKKKHNLNITLKRNPVRNWRDHAIKTFLEILNIVKLYHWSTHSYSQHVATDELYHDLNKYIDEFVEIMLGKSKRRFKTIKISSASVDTKKVFITKINSFKQYLMKLNDKMDKTEDSNLFNIRDEILGTLDKLIYLFELK
jgi:DNA-binding ferritin-like protein